MNKYNKTNRHIDTEKLVVTNWERVQEGQIGVGDYEVQLLGIKLNKSQGYNVQHREYSQNSISWYSV